MRESSQARCGRHEAPFFRLILLYQGHNDGTSCLCLSRWCKLGTNYLGGLAGGSPAVFRAHSGERVRSFVSFKSQFSASQDKAHNRNIATKIHEEMAKLRASVDASPATQRRWVWELIQNAKDVNIDGKVRVRIEADLDGSDAHVIFRHNGGAF